MSRALEIARRAERFDEVERSDPVMAFVHLVAACAWMATVSIARAPEGIAFGILMAVAAVRVPRTARLYPELFGSTAFVLMVAFAEWQGLSALWSSAPKLGLRDLVQRFVFVPFALWPVMHRWRMLVHSLALAAATHAAIIAITGFARHGWTPGTHIGIITSDIGVTGLVFAVAAASMWGRPGPPGWMAGSAKAVLTGTLAAATLLLGQRMPAIAGTAGVTAAIVRPDRWTRRRVLVAAGAAVLALAAVAASMAATPRNRQWLASTWNLTVGGQVAASDEALIAATGARLPLARMAVDIWRDHPIFGAGARGYATGLVERVKHDPAAFGIPPDQASDFIALTCAHNAVLDEAAERGVIGVGLLVALVAACWYGAWKLDPWSGTAGMMATWTVACLTQSMTVRGVPMLLLAVIVTRVCAVSRDD